MTKTVQAKYSKGKLEPLEKLDLEEGKEVTVTISDMPDIERAAFLKLPIDTRREILARQAAAVAAAYEANAELTDVGAGDLVDY